MPHNDYREIYDNIYKIAIALNKQNLKKLVSYHKRKCSKMDRQMDVCNGLD